VCVIVGRTGRVPPSGPELVEQAHLVSNSSQRVFFDGAREKTPLALSAYERPGDDRMDTETHD